MGGYAPQTPRISTRAAPDRKPRPSARGALGFRSEAARVEMPSSSVRPLPHGRPRPRLAGLVVRRSRHLLPLDAGGEVGVVVVGFHRHPGALLLPGAAIVAVARERVVEGAAVPVLERP